MEPLCVADKLAILIDTLQMNNEQPRTHLEAISDLRVCCPETYLSFSNTTGCLPDASQSINRDNSGNRVVCSSYKDISGCVYKDNSGNRVTSVCPSQKDNSGNRVTSVCSSYKDISGANYVDVNTYGSYFDADRNVRPIWSPTGQQSR